jgi:hypothetical protein
MSWEVFKTSVAEAAKLARPEEFDHLALVTESYPQLRRYAPRLLEAFEFRSTSASEELLQAVALLRELNLKKHATCSGPCSQGVYPTTLAKARLHQRGNRSAFLRNMRPLGVGQKASGRGSLGCRQPPSQRF